MARVQPDPLWQRAVILLAGTMIGLVIVLALIWARPVLIPIAMAVLLTFLLNPLVRTLQHRGLGRLGSVILAVSGAGIILMSMGIMVTNEVASVLAKLPQHTTIIKAKVQSLRRLNSGILIGQFETMIDEISQEIQESPTGKTLVLKKPPILVPQPNASSEAVASSSRASFPWMSLTGYLGSALEVLGTLAFSMILLVFFLLGREDLRDRIVLLAGKARLALTSKALEDVTERITRYILMVALLNGGYGLLMTIGLYFLRVPNAFLWGFLAAGLRFIPYVGPWVGAIFPIVMSLATSDGWSFPLGVFGYIVVLELISNNVIEPMAFGHSTGVSPTALIISAAFWMYLWGPIGLVLSAPIAVCLVVLGKNIAQLNFLNLLLGDGPALRDHVGLYQRLMLGDQQEASALILERMKTSPVEEVYDALLIPSLNYTRRDLQRDYLSDDDQRMIIEGMRKTLLVLDESAHCLTAETLSLQILKEQAPALQDLEALAVLRLPTVLGCPARDDTDDVGLEMLRQLLNPTRFILEVASVDSLVSELVARIAENPPVAICIASLPPGGKSHARYLCKRLREAAPEIQIIVGRWGPNGVSKLDRERLVAAGANSVTTTLLETRKLLESRLLVSIGEPLTSIAS
jgi:predicted PurR-regulated permease PerM